MAHRKRWAITRNQAQSGSRFFGDPAARALNVALIDGERSRLFDGITWTWITRDYFSARRIEKKIVSRVCFNQSAEPAPSGFKTLHSLNPNRPIAGEFSENIKRASQSRPPVRNSSSPTAPPKTKVDEVQSNGQASAIGAHAKPRGRGIYDGGRNVILERGPRVSKF